MRIGAHLPHSGGKLVVNAVQTRAEAMQIFASNPRGWAVPRVDRETDATTAAMIESNGLGPLFLHVPYLVNVASANDEFQEKSALLLAWTLERAASLRAAGVVVHAGAAGGAPRDEGIRRFRAAVMRSLEHCRDGVRLVVELTAGGTGTLACTWPEANELLECLNHDERVGFCFDTCHAHAAGYELSTPDGMEACIAEMDATIGRDRLLLVHANDSKDARGSRRDRHHRIGDGEIGDEGFRALVRSPVVQHVPLVVETPGKLTDTARDVAHLRMLAGSE